MTGAEKYILSYTRDTGLLIQQSWMFAIENLYKILAGDKAGAPVVIDYLHDGTIEIYENTVLIEKINTLLLEKNLRDSKFFDLHFQEYIKGVGYFENLWVQGYTSSADDLKQILTRLNDQIEHYVVYYLSQLNDKTPGDILKRATEVRMKDEFFSKTSKFLQQSLINIYPELSDVVSAILQSEVLNPPEKMELVQRINNFVITPEKFFRGDIKELPYEFENIKEEAIIKGQTAFKGNVKGRVFILKRNNQIHDIKEGDILVSPMTTPEHMIAIKKAAAIVTDEGGILSHAAIISRELKIPCVIGTKIATKVLKDGDEVEVDADNGIVKIIKK